MLDTIAADRTSRLAPLSFQPDAACDNSLASSSASLGSCVRWCCATGSLCASVSPPSIHFPCIGPILPDIDFIPCAFATGFSWVSAFASAHSPPPPHDELATASASEPYPVPAICRYREPPPMPLSNATRARTFVERLERIDAELRVRMIRLGMGDIGDWSANFGGPKAATPDNTATPANVGCGICYEQYDVEDRPAWLASSSAEANDAQAVGIPCPGHHVVHAHCLREWFSSIPPATWSCPFCRAFVDMSTAWGRGSVRDEVRARERKLGWRCDAPACLPRYPEECECEGAERPPPSGGNVHPDDEAADRRDLPAGSRCGPDAPDESALGQMYALTPCRHEFHLECLLTSARVKGDLARSEYPDLLGKSDDIDSPLLSSRTPKYSTPYRLVSPSWGREAPYPPTTRDGRASAEAVPDHASSNNFPRRAAASSQTRRKVTQSVARVWHGLAQCSCTHIPPPSPPSSPSPSPSPPSPSPHRRHHRHNRSSSSALRRKPPRSHPESGLLSSAIDHGSSVSCTPSRADNPGEVDAAAHVSSDPAEDNALLASSPSSDERRSSSAEPKSAFSRTPEGRLRTAGHWISCPACRKEVWADLPILCLKNARSDS